MKLIKINFFYSIHYFEFVKSDTGFVTGEKFKNQNGGLKMDVPEYFSKFPFQKFNSCKKKFRNLVGLRDFQ